MKKIIALLLVATMVLSFAACAQAPENNVPETTVPTEPSKILETEKVKLDGFFVDESYQDSEGKPLKMVYVFLTFKPSETNFDVDGKYTELKIGENTYSSDFYKGSCRFMPNYYYSSFIEEIYVGTECKLALTFKVPEGDLQPGKEVTMSDTSMPVSELLFSTDDLVRCANPEEIGKQADPDGCAGVVAKREIADEATTQKVRDAINGYYFTFYVSLGTSVTKYELEFYAENDFEIRTPYLNNSGTYEVHNGYIFLHYETSDTPVEIEYEFNENGEISLYCADAFSIYE